MHTWVLHMIGLYLQKSCTNIYIFLLHIFDIFTDVTLSLFEWILVKKELGTYIFLVMWNFVIFTADISAWWTWSKHSRSTCIFDKWWLLTWRICCCWLAWWGIYYLKFFLVTICPWPASIMLLSNTNFVYLYLPKIQSESKNSQNAVCEVNKL